MRTKAILCAAAVACAAGASAGNYPETTLWKSGDGGIAVYRIPALCTAPDGSLVAVCDARKEHIGDLNSLQPINITMRRSEDGGATWSPAVNTWTWPWDAKSKWSGSDPSFIVDSAAKKIFLFYNVWKFDDEKNLDNNIYRFFVQESADNGKTWSKPREITKSIAFPGWNFGQPRNRGGCIFVSSGSGVQTSDGTLLHTLVNVSKGENALFGSTDHGKTWRPVGRPMRPGDECKVAELPDGSWMVNSRWRGGGRQIFVSRDRGETWEGRYDKTLEDPQCNAQLMRYGDNLLFSNCKSPNRRALLHLKASRDGGATWSPGLCIEPAGAAYSDMTEIAGGDIGLLYEGAGYSTIRFVRLPKADVEAEIAKAKAPPRPFRFMTFNIFGAGYDSLRGGPGGFTAKEREDRAMAVVRRHAPDLISWQEVNAQWWQSPLFRGMAEYGVVRGDEDEALVRAGADLSKRQPDWVNHEPLMYRKDRLELLDSGLDFFHISLQVEKSLTWAVLADKESGRRFIAFATHFWWKTGAESDAIRELNARHVLLRIDAIRAKWGNLPVIGGGDLNCAKGALALRTFDQFGYDDAGETAPVRSTVPSEHGPLVRDAEGRCKGRVGKIGEEGHAMLDHVLCERGRVKALRHDVVIDEDAIDISDHSPVVVDFQLAN